MSAQQDNTTKDNLALDNQKGARNLTIGNWITIIAGGLFIVSLFLVWASTGGFLSSIGYGFLQIYISHASGLPILFSLTLLAALGCIFLSTHLLKIQGKGKVVPVIRIILAVLGLIPFGLLPFELKTWTPYGHMEFGGWLAVFAALGLLLGAILTFNED